jgi:Zn-dependent protease/CBS domain-containing protein
MSWSIKLFRVKGIDVKVHLTFVLILIWAAYHWSGTTGQGWLGALFGIVATLLLFTSVLLHEFGHSLQALKFGIPVRDITLLPIGGVAQIEEMPEKPGQELRIALAGPLVNFAIAAFLIVIGLALQARAVVTVPDLMSSLGSASWRGMLSYLTMANLLLGLFNLIPAYPMDGGRVLRALLALKLDYSRATSIAVRVGQGLAFLAGMYGFMSGSYTLILIAIFVWMGAGQEGKQVEVKGVLRQMTVGQAMTRAPATLFTGDTLARAAGLTLTTTQADFPVLDRRNGRLAGLLTAQDLLRGLKSDGEASPIDSVMHTGFATTTVDEPLFQAQQRMERGSIRALPVVDGRGDLVGLLTAEDVNEAYRLLSATPALAVRSERTATATPGKRGEERQPAAVG